MKVLLVDDHALFKAGLRNLLMSRNIEVVGSAGDGCEALEQARVLKPDVILMDIQMPVCDGLKATRLIKADQPDIKIVMLTVSAEDEDLFEALKSGASGYLLKSLDADTFFDLLEGVAQGEVAITPEMALRILNEFVHPAKAATNDNTPNDEEMSLTDRQIEVLRLMVDGKTYREIGAALSVTERTVKYHVKEIVQKLHLRNKSEVIAYALRNGLVPGK